MKLLRRKSERGAVIVEMAFIAPMLMLFLIGSLQVGLVVIGNSTASNGAREGARAASIRYECADNHISARCTTNPSANYTYIRNAVMSRLVGLVKEASVTVTVQCRDGSASGPAVLCEKGYADPDNDVVVVSIGWRHIGATPYIADQVHTSVANSVIIGRPNLTTSTSTTTPTPTTSTTTTTPATDEDPPSLLAAVAYDTNLDGVLDQIKLTFDEDIVQSVNKDGFSINNSVTGSTNIASATVAARVVTLSLSGGTTINTAPGSMGIALSGSSDGIRDLAGNQASFGATALTDAAAPIFTGLSDTAGLNPGFPNSGDTVTLTFSEPIATSLAATTTITYSDPAGNNPDTIQIASISAGPQTTSSDDYNTKNNSDITLSATVAKVGNTVVVMVVACTTNCSDLGTVSDDAAWNFAPATSLVDAAGLAVSSTRPTSNLF